MCAACKWSDKVVLMLCYIHGSDMIILFSFQGGEELFGLTVTEYPNLQRIRKELSLLQKLYSLYNSVIDNVNGYYDILWQEIDIEKINNELLEYQNRCTLDY